jgi:hypothetical protein
MKKNKLFYKKRLMSNSIPVISILVAVALIFGSGVSAIDLTNNTNSGKENMAQAYIETAPDGLAPAAITAQLASNGNSAQEMGSSSDSNYAPLSMQTYMYGYTAALGPHGEGCCYWDIEEPGDIIQLNTETSLNFLAGGTYTCDEKWLAVEYFNGGLWICDPETGDIEEIGGGGTGLNGLAEDPTTQTLYGCSSYDLMKINPETGEQEVIGSFGTGQTHIALAFDMSGTCYSWDVKFSGESYIYQVDLETGEATTLFGTGKTLLYAQDGAYLREQELLYLSAYIYNPEYGGYEVTVNLDTEEVEVIGAFEGSAEITASMFIQDCIPPEHDVGVKKILQPEDGYAVDPLPIELLIKNYGNNSEITDAQFEVIKCEEGPLLNYENFTNWPPAGWNTYGYYQSYTQNAIGTPPEAKYTYPPYYSYGYMESPAVNATGFEKISMKFRLLGEFSTYYSPYFYVHYRKNSSSPWRDASPWEVPVSGDLGPFPFEIGCYGWGEDLGSAFQIRFYFGSPYYYLLYGSGIFIDDVYIIGCAGCAEYAEVVEDIEVPFEEEVIVDDFPGWTPSEWQNPDYQDTWEEYPLSAYTLLEDNNSKNDKKQRLLSLYYPFLHDVTSLSFEGVETGPAQVFPVKATIKNVGQFEECCFKVHMQIAEIDFDSAISLHTQSFYPYYYFPPSGWTRTNTKWGGSYSNYCGQGDYAEARFYYWPSETGMFRLYTPALDTTGYGAVYIEFTHYVNHYTTPYILRVETSPDGNTWDSVWDLEPSGSVATETIEIITGENVGTDNFRVSWTFDGYSWNINYWYIDMVTIKGIPISEPEYTDEVCVEDIIPGEEILYEFDDWEPVFLPLEESGQKTYACKSWTSLDDPEDNNRANDAYQKNVVLDYFHDVSIMTTSPSGGRGHDIIWDNGDTDGSNGYSLLGSPRRSILDDFQLEKSGKLSEAKALVGYTGAHSQEWEITFWTDDEGDPGLEIETMVSTEFSEEATGRSWFGYAEYEISQMFEPFKMAPGYYWFELWPGSGASNTWWWRRVDYWRSQCWVNYDDYGFMPGQNVFGVPADVSYQLWGGAGVDVYIAPGNQDITALAENHGTFPERDMTAYANIYEFITDCENATLIYEDMIEGIDILEPLGGSQDLTFADFNFVDEGMYMVQFEIEDDDDDFGHNNIFETGIGVDDTPPVTFEPVLEPAAPDGDNNWYVSDLTVTLTAEDPEIGCDVSGSGVDYIKYAIDGTQGTLTGDTGSFVVHDDGDDVLIEYWAVDMVGNIESKHSFTIDMDQTVPDIDPEGVHWEAFKDGGLWYVKFWTNATDDTSGMNRVMMYINEGLHEVNSSPDGAYYEFIIMWSTAFETCTFKWEHYDDAGWHTDDEIFGEEVYSNSYSSETKQYNQHEVRSL